MELSHNGCVATAGQTDSIRGSSLFQVGEDETRKKNLELRNSGKRDGARVLFRT
jgi:hypothetical protein